jgi:hypothetical protein
VTPRKIDPEKARVRAALQRLVEYPEWQDFIAFSKAKVENVAVDPTAPNTSALLMVEGRRSFHRELIERLKDRLRDERGTGGDG